MDITPIPFDGVLLAAAVLAGIVAALAEVAKKLGASNSRVVITVLASGQLLSVGWWTALAKYTAVGLYLAILIGLLASLAAMGFYKLSSKKPVE